MALARKPSFKALNRRYRAGIEAVEQGADPLLTLSYVVWPPLTVAQASRGELPQGWRMRSDEEVRALKNERDRRYREPTQRRWAA